MDLGCGASENSCRTAGVRAVGLSSAAPVHGRCAATEAAACRSGTPNRSSPADVAREDGACGAGRNQCVGGARRLLAPTDAAYRWRCLGIDGARRWSCPGADGGSSWRCEYGGRSRSCSLPTYGYGDRSCSEPAGTASDSPVCLECKPGHAEDENGDCVKVPEMPVCGSAEASCDVGTSAQSRDSLNPPVNKWTCSSAGETKNCTDPAPPPDCGADEHHALDAAGELTCAPNPYCPSPLEENQCGPASATFMDLEDSVKHGKRKPTKAQGCYRKDAFRDLPDVSPKNGKCASQANQCDDGTTATNQRQSASEYRWDCVGVDGSKDNWKCEGKDGHRKWQCSSGSMTQSCRIPVTGVEVGTHDQGGTTVPATSERGCMACKPGHKLSGGACVKVLAADAGGNKGKYRVIRFGFTPPYIAISATYYTTTVSASATGGVPPYRFQWSDHHLSGAQVTYVFGLTQSFPVSRTVTVTDSAAPSATDRATATIHLPPPSAAAPGSGAPGPRKGFAFEVPLGGERLFVWGGGGAVTVRSENSDVAGVGVSSPAFRVAGAGLGETYVILRAGSEAMALPVVVR